MNVKKYPVDEFGRLGGLYSLVDLPINRFVTFKELSDEDQAKIKRWYDKECSDNL